MHKELNGEGGTEQNACATGLGAGALRADGVLCLCVAASPAQPGERRTAARAQRGDRVCVLMRMDWLWAHVYVCRVSSHG